MRVLIVDDDPEIQDFLSNCLTKLGATQVDFAPTGEDALGKIVVCAYDLVTLDTKMPGASGPDILSVLRGMIPWAVIAIVSGYVEAVTDVARAHADLVLAKPLHLEKFTILVQLTTELVAKRDAIRRLGADTEEA